MTNISRDDIVKLAQLSNLNLAEDEIEALQNDISNILDYVKQLDELNTEGVTPAYQVTRLQNVMRPDEVKISEVSREQLLALTHENKDNHIKVPKVL